MSLRCALCYGLIVFVGRIIRMHSLADLRELGRDDQDEKARKWRATGGLIQPTRSVASAGKDEEHSGQECHHDDDANGQEGHIRRQGLSDASRPRSFLVQGHMGSRL